MTDRGQALLNGTERGVRVEYVNLDGVHSGKLLSRAKFAAGLDGGWSFPDLAFGLCLGNTARVHHGLRVLAQAAQQAVQLRHRRHRH